jgi:hypothetical protein
MRPWAALKVFPLWSLAVARPQWRDHHLLGLGNLLLFIEGVGLP